MVLGWLKYACKSGYSQHNWHAEEKLLRWRVLVTVVNLLPHVEVVVSPRIELERNSLDIMEHEI